MFQQEMSSVAPELRPARLAPNLIMPGVAKCGTTTLYHALVQHPDIAGGIDKELRYLLDKDDEHYRPESIHNHGLTGWMARYPDGGRGPYRYWIDASPQYQFQSTAYQTIAALPEAPRLLFVVRRPSHRLFSVYQYSRYQLGKLPHITSFAQFIDEARAHDASAARSRNMQHNAFADTRYDEMLERWSAIVPPGHVWVTSIEALNEDQPGVLNDLAGWLGIDPAPLQAISPLQVNPTVRVRSQALVRLDAWVSRCLPERGLLRRAKNWARARIDAPLPAGEKAENSDLCAQLDREFAPHVERFNALAAAMQPGFRPLLV